MSHASPDETIVPLGLAEPPLQDFDTSCEPSLPASIAEMKIDQTDMLALAVDHMLVEHRAKWDETMLVVRQRHEQVYQELCTLKQKMPAELAQAKAAAEHAQAARLADALARLAAAEAHGVEVGARLAEAREAHGKAGQERVTELEARVAELAARLEEARLAADVQAAAHVMVEALPKEPTVREAELEAERDRLVEQLKEAKAAEDTHGRELRELYLKRAEEAEEEAALLRKQLPDLHDLVQKYIGEASFARLTSDKLATCQPLSSALEALRLLHANPNSAAKERDEGVARVKRHLDVLLGGDVLAVAYNKRAKEGD